MTPMLRRAPLPATLVVILALGAAMAPAVRADNAPGDQSPSYTGTQPPRGGPGALRLRITLVGRRRARALARSGILRVRVSANVGAFVVLRSAIRGSGGRRVGRVAAPKQVVVLLPVAGTKTTVVRLPPRLRASLRSAKRVSISLRASGQSGFGTVGRATLSRRFGR